MPSLAPPWRWAGSPGLRAAAAVLALFGALLVWTFALRSPFLSVEGSDDAFFVAVANLWTRGVLPYVGAFDVKPPGYFAILAGAQSLLGPSLTTLKIVTIGFDAVTATALYCLGARMGSRAIGVFAALLYPLLSQCVTNNAPYAPLAAFTTLAFLAALSSRPLLGRALLSGLALGAALAIKQTAAFEGLALFAIILRAPDPAGLRLKAGAAFVAAAAAAPLAFLVYFALNGAAGPMLGDVVLGALRRPGSAVEGVTLLEGFLRSFTLLMRPIAPMAIFAGFALLRRPAIGAEFPRASLAPLGLWAAAALVSVWAQRALFMAYMGPLLAPLLLLAGAAVAYAPAPLRRIRRRCASPSPGSPSSRRSASPAPPGSTCASTPKRSTRPPKRSRRPAPRRRTGSSWSAGAPGSMPRPTSRRPRPISTGSIRCATFPGPGPPASPKSSRRRRAISSSPIVAATPGTNSRRAGG